MLNSRRGTDGKGDAVDEAGIKGAVVAVADAAAAGTATAGARDKDEGVTDDDNNDDDADGAVVAGVRFAKNPDEAVRVSTAERIAGVDFSMGLLAEEDIGAAALVDEACCLLQESRLGMRDDAEVNVASAAANAHDSRPTSAFFSISASVPAANASTSMAPKNAYASSSSSSSDMKKKK